MVGGFGDESPHVNAHVWRVDRFLLGGEVVLLGGLLVVRWRMEGGFEAQVFVVVLVLESLGLRVESTFSSRRTKSPMKKHPGAELSDSPHLWAWWTL